MISFFYETDFKLSKPAKWRKFLSECIKSEGFEAEEINYIFCGDEYLLKINRDFLQHDYYTDVIGFQYSEARQLSGDIYISIERVQENAKENRVGFENELARVMIHGVLHFMNYKDKSAADAKKMKNAENKYLELFE
jgi:rRNA maturation RNase YbeY